MLTASAELGDLREVSLEFFDKYLKDVAMNAGLVILLILASLFSGAGRSDRISTILFPVTRGTFRNYERVRG